MEQVINLDDAAAAIGRRIPTWRLRGLTVGAVTWADGQTFDHEITPDRQRVRGDYSVGFRVTRGDEEGGLILYAGGWCDLEYWSGDAASDPVVDAPGWTAPLDLPGFERLLDRFDGLFPDGG